MQTQRKSGFALIELLVMIAIIATLATILFPVFQKVYGNPAAPPASRTLNSSVQRLSSTRRTMTKSTAVSHPIFTEGMSRMAHRSYNGRSTAG